MCKSHNPRVIDKCMRKLIRSLGLRFRSGAKVVACCCGHGKYPMTILIKYKRTGAVEDICSYKFIPRKRKFYKKDKEGYYYIPEVVGKEKNGNTKAKK